MALPRTALRALLTLVFAITGFTALTLQVVWQRVIALHGGVDLYATTTVVAVFLGGLGLGSLVGGALADRLGPRRSVAAFAGANAGIAAFAVASPWLFYDLYRDLVPSLHGTLPSFAFHVALLIVPTTLMGVSLPLLARGLVERDAEIAAVVGRLYAVNTLGAAAGAAASGWYLLGTHGFVGTIRLAAAGNLAAAALATVAFVVVGRTSTATPASAPSGQAVDERAGHHDARDDRAWPWYLLYALTGAVALGLEVLFFRIVDTVMRSNSYTFGHVLSLYLVLFGAGGAIGSRLVRRARRPEQWFLWLQCAAGLGALVGVLLLLAPLKLPDLGGLGLRPFLETYYATDGLASGFHIGRAETVYVTLVAPLLVMGVPVLCFGAAFPFVQALAARRVDVVGRRTGRLLAANVAGNVVGTLVTGFVLLDRLGTAGTVRLLASLLVVPAVGAAVLAGAPVRRLVAAGAAVALGLQLVVLPTNHGLWALLHSAPADGFVAVEERACLDTLARRPAGQVLYVNGASQNAYPYDDFHVLIGLLPSLVHPDPDRALAVGLGIGGTTFGLALDERLDVVRTVEICGGQIDLVRHLAEHGDSPESRRLLADERVDLVVADGRKHLLGTPSDSLDVVVVDTLRPQSGYSGNLYSREFYELVADRLAADGVFTQWLPTGRTLETMQETFPHLLVFTVPTYFGSRFAIASERPLTFDRPRLLAALGAADTSTFPPGFEQAIVRFVTEVEPEVVAGRRPIGADRRNEDLFPRDEYWLNNGD
jgi:spermidine synthase